MSASIFLVRQPELPARDEARRWFELSEVWFLQTENASGNLSKLAYQRLALKLEEREFAEVLNLAPLLMAAFEKLGMAEDAIKTRFLYAAVLKETDRIHDAIAAYREVAHQAEDLHHDSLVASATVNLVQIYSAIGETEEALKCVQTATELLRRVGDRIALSKLHWGVGYLMRSQNDASGAIQAFRFAQQEFSELGMRADVAAVQLIIADLLLDAGQEKQAEWEIRQALPIIDEYKLVPEGFAAMTLLRESLRRQKIDRQALRSLHGYFEELQN
jgi:tetratricopeptide (TPR) repeat protein